VCGKKRWQRVGAVVSGQGWGRILNAVLTDRDGPLGELANGLLGGLATDGLLGEPATDGLLGELATDGREQ
jgi:hypothetical protein